MVRYYELHAVYRRLMSSTGTNSPPGSLGEATLDFDLVMGLLSAKQEVKQYAVGAANDTGHPSMITPFF